MSGLYGLQLPYPFGQVLVLLAAVSLLCWVLLRRRAKNEAGKAQAGELVFEFKKKEPGEALPPPATAGVMADGIMGLAKEDEGVSVVGADDFGFSNVAADQLGLLADVQEEVRVMCELLAEQDGTKEDFFMMFSLVREKYPKLGSHPLRPSLEHYIREMVPFFISSAELESLWD